MANVNNLEAVAEQETVWEGRAEVFVSNWEEQNEMQLDIKWSKIHISVSFIIVKRITIIKTAMILTEVQLLMLERTFIEGFL